MSTIKHFDQVQIFMREERFDALKRQAYARVCRDYPPNSWSQEKPEIVHIVLKASEINCPEAEGADLHWDFRWIKKDDDKQDDDDIPMEVPKKRPKNTSRGDWMLRDLSPYVLVRNRSMDFSPEPVTEEEKAKDKGLRFEK